MNKLTAKCPNCGSILSIDPHIKQMRDVMPNATLHTSRDPLCPSCGFPMPLYEFKEEKTSHQEKETSKSESSCFVATAIFENPDHPKVIIFRQFRDNILSNYQFGKLFINFYYSVGPRLASFVIKYSFIKRFSKRLLSVAAEQLNSLDK